MTVPQAPERVAVLGAGTMGAGIAVAFGRAGSQVRLMARRESSLEGARRRISESLAVLQARGALSKTEAQASRERIETTLSLTDAVAGVELVVESVIEDVDAKRDVLARAEEAAPAAILATDTSSIAIDALATALRRPEAFAGFHWFNPPELVPLVEVVSGPTTAPATVDTLVGWAVGAGKRPVHVRRDTEGFIANRLQYALFREAFSLAEEGVCDYGDLDEAVRFGLGARWAAVGPFESLDLAGLDVHEAVARRLYPVLARGTEPAAAVTALVGQGHLGCKTGAGLYGTYDEQAIERLTRRRADLLLALEELSRGWGATDVVDHST